MKVFNLVESNEEISIEIRGEIGGSWWNDGVTYDKVAAQLKGAVGSKKKVKVKINSLGGDVDEALAIYELLLSMGDRVTTICEGRCASAATIIAMGGHERLMSRYALFLVHKCWSGVVGNENVLEEELDAQRSINDRMAQIYADRTGRKKEDIEELMNLFNGDGAWLNVEQAMEYGFITGQLPNETKPAEAEYLKDRVKDMLKFKNHKEMKKNITSLALLCTLLACQEVDAKDNKALLDDDQLKKINDTLAAKDAEIKQLKADKAAAETAKTEAEGKVATAEAAKTEAEGKVTTANTEKATLQTRITELEAILKRLPKQDPPAGGSDTKQGNDGEESFEDWYAKQGYVQEAKATLGR